MDQGRKDADYRAYLLRCRRSGQGPGADVSWRCSLEDPHTGRRRTFADVNALLAALRQDLAGSDGSARRHGPSSLPTQTQEGEGNHV